jgi:hypothetical protein
VLQNSKVAGVRDYRLHAGTTIFDPARLCAFLAQVLIRPDLRLLIKSWQDERAMLPDCALVLGDGLLTKQDIHRIKLAVFGEDV